MDRPAWLEHNPEELRKHEERVRTEHEKVLPLLGPEARRTLDEIFSPKKRRQN